MLSDRTLPVAHTALQRISWQDLESMTLGPLLTLVLPVNFKLTLNIARFVISCLREGYAGETQLEAKHVSRTAYSMNMMPALMYAYKTDKTPV